ncbi:MAG: NAD(P)H-dependent oxidoreductase subunit E [Nanoarchaeota archaeon]
MVFVRKVTVQGTSYYYLFHIKRSGNSSRKYKKFLGKTKPTGERFKRAKQRFLDEIRRDPHSFEKPHDRNVVEMLQHIQADKGFIATEDIVKLSKELHIPAVELVGVATFYSQFSFTRPGRYTIRICNGTACHVKKSPALTSYLSKELGIGPSQVTDDGLFGLESVNCIGACARAPAMMVNDTVYGELTKEKIASIINDLKEHHPDR